MLPMNCNGLLSAVAHQDLGGTIGERQRCNRRDDKREIIATRRPVFWDEFFAGEPARVETEQFLE